MDHKLSREQARENDIFEERGNKENRSVNSQIEEIERQKLSENERLKGNECMKCKEYNEAVDCYGKAIELNPTDAATYSNRAMAHLKLKEYARALEDAEAAIKLKENYVKAYHRRGKAYLAMNKIEMAIRDFQYILEKEPKNKEAMQEIKNARKKLDEKLGTSNGSTSLPAAHAKNKFTRVAIQEELDEGEDEKPKDETFNVTKGGETEQSTEEPKKSVLIEEVKSTTESIYSQEDKTWWKKGTETLNYDDFKKTETKPQPKEQQKPPQKMTRVQIEESEDEEEPAKTVNSTITLD